MNTLAIILARGGSKGLKNKALLPLAGRPVISYTFGHAQQSLLLDAICLSSDAPRVQELARHAGIEVIERPAELATDSAAVVDALRHALEAYEARHNFRADIIVALYANIPVRAAGIIDRAIQYLSESGADSVRTVTPVGKMHPDWMHRLDGDRLIQYRPNTIHRRQELSPLYMHDGAVVAVTRDALLRADKHAENPLAFFGSDCRAIVQEPTDTVDIDGLADLLYAEAVLRLRSEQAFFARPERVLNTRPVLTGAVGRFGRR